MAPQPGDIVFEDGAMLVITCITVRQRRGMCAKVVYGDNSGHWVEIVRLRPFDWHGSHAWMID